MSDLTAQSVLGLQVPMVHDPSDFATLIDEAGWRFPVGRAEARRAARRADVVLAGEQWAHRATGTQGAPPDLFAAGVRSFLAWWDTPEGAAVVRVMLDDASVAGDPQAERAESA